MRDCVDVHFPGELNRCDSISGMPELSALYAHLLFLFKHSATQPSEQESEEMSWRLLLCRVEADAECCVPLGCAGAVGTRRGNF